MHTLSVGNIIQQGHTKIIYEVIEVKQLNKVTTYLIQARTKEAANLANVWITHWRMEHHFKLLNTKAVNLLYKRR